MKTAKPIPCSGRTRLSQRRSESLSLLLISSRLLGFALLVHQGKKGQPVSCIISIQDKEIYRWPFKESIKAMLAWEWTLEKARDGETEKVEVKTTRKISQTAHVRRDGQIHLKFKIRQKGMESFLDKPILHTYCIFGISNRQPMTPARDTLPNRWTLQAWLCPESYRYIITYMQGIKWDFLCALAPCGILKGAFKV